MDRRQFVAGTAAAALAGSSAYAQDTYPTRPVTFINPFPPGGAPLGYGGPGGYGPPGGYGYPPPAPTPNPELKKQATTWLIVAVASFFFCGGANCFGVIGGILAFLAMQAADQGNSEDGEAKLKYRVRSGI